jgi:transcriptional regulator with XRE-family HTH domain
MFDLRKAVKRLAAEHNWTQQDIAERAGITQSHLSLALKKQNPTLSTLTKLSVAFGVQLSILIREGE